MALQGSGIITLADIAAEFGGAAPHALSEYYAGGAYVPGGTGGVPSSGQISLSDFYGTSAAFVCTVTEGTRTVDPSGIEFKFSGWIQANKYWVGAAFASSNFNAAISMGARSPTTFNGRGIQGLYERKWTKNSTCHFVVILAGTLAKSFFTSVNVQGLGLLLSTNSAHSQDSGSTIWEWVITDNARWDGSGTSTVTFA